MDPDGDLDGGNDDGDDDDDVGAEIKFMPCAVRNMTELPLRFASKPSSGSAVEIFEGGTDVKPMATVAFETAEQAAANKAAEATGGLSLIARGLGTAEAHTSNCEELVGAARDGDKELVFQLLQRRANVNSTRTGQKAKTALHEAAKHKQNDTLGLLLAARADVESPTSDKHHMRPLHYAARAGSLQCVLQLLRFGADAAATTAEGQTARNLAAGYSEVAKVLENALELTVRQQGGRRFPNAQLVEAARKGNRERVKSLLGQLADPNSSDGTMTALSRACLERHADVASQLLLARAHVDHVPVGSQAKGGRGLRALHYAARAGPIKTVNILIASRANPASLCPEGTLPLDKVSKLHTRDGSAIKEFLYAQLMLQCEKYGSLVRMSDDRKKAKSVFCIVLPTQLCFYADATSTTQLKGRVDLTQVERIRTPCIKPQDTLARGQWTSITDRGRTLHDDRSLEIGDSTQTTILYAESPQEAEEWAGLLRSLVQLVGEGYNLQGDGFGALPSEPLHGMNGVSADETSSGRRSFISPQQYTTGWRSGAEGQHVPSSTKAPNYETARDSNASSAAGNTPTKRDGGASGVDDGGGESSSASSTDLVQLKLGDGSFEPLYDISMGMEGGLSVHLLKQASNATLRSLYSAATHSGKGGKGGHGGMPPLPPGSSLDDMLRGSMSSLRGSITASFTGPLARRGSAPMSFPLVDPSSTAVRTSMTTDDVVLTRQHTRSRGGSKPSHRRSTSNPTSAAEVARAQLGGVSALGVVCETRLHRGGRHLIVKSSVEVLNLTDEPLLLTMPPPPGAPPDAQPLAPVRIEPGESKPLPLRFTGQGSDAACRSLQLMPADGFSWGSLVSHGSTSLLSCPAATGNRVERANSARSAFSDAPSSAAAVAQAEAALNEGARTWMACVRVDFLSTAERYQPSKYATRVNAGDVLKRYHLDASEILLHMHTCLLPPAAATTSASTSTAGSSRETALTSAAAAPSSAAAPTAAPAAAKANVPVPCTLCMTPGFLCLGSAHGAHTHRWADIDVIRRSAIRTAGLPHAIEIVLASGKQFTIGGFINRDKTVEQMTRLRKMAREKLASGLNQWQPRRLVLQSPLCITSLLPCTVHVEMEQQRDELSDLYASVAGGSYDGGGVGGCGGGGGGGGSEAASPNRFARTGQAMRHASYKHANARPTQVERLTIAPGGSYRVHSLHVSTPLSLRMWVDGETQNTSRLQGKLTFQRPSGPCEQQLTLTIYPPNETASSYRAVVLRANLTTSQEGCCVLTLVSPHWLVNNSSLPLRVFNARDTVMHVLEAPPRTDKPLLFHIKSSNDSLGVDERAGAGASVASSMLGGSSAGSAKLGIAPQLVRSPPPSAAAAAAAASAARGGGGLIMQTLQEKTAAQERAYVAPPPAVKTKRADLSAPFSIDAVGTDGPIEVKCEDGSIAELSVSIDPSSDALTSAKATFVTVRDRFIIRNDTAIDFDFHEQAAEQTTTSSSVPAEAGGAQPSFINLLNEPRHLNLLPADGTDVPLRWHRQAGERSGKELQRKLRLRPHSGSHDWCAYFSAEAVGKVILKLRPKPPSHEDLMGLRAGVGAGAGAGAGGLIGGGGGGAHRSAGAAAGKSGGKSKQKGEKADAAEQSALGETMYLVLTVSMHGSQRVLHILPMQNRAKRQLPYQVDAPLILLTPQALCLVTVPLVVLVLPHSPSDSPSPRPDLPSTPPLRALLARPLSPPQMVNRSDLLIAFRQHGCARWDLLGVAESCDYIWDDPSGNRALQVHACDNAGLFSGTSSAEAYHVARQERRFADLRLEGRPDAASTAPSVARDAARAPMLLSAACKLVTAYHEDSGQHEGLGADAAAGPAAGGGGGGAAGAAGCSSDNNRGDFRDLCGVTGAARG